MYVIKTKKSFLRGCGISTYGTHIHVHVELASRSGCDANSNESKSLEDFSLIDALSGEKTGGVNGSDVISLPRRQ